MFDRSMEALARIAIGLGLLGFGRSLFWLFVALVGFAVGLEIGVAWLPTASALLRVLLALVCGALGALLAVFLQRVAIAVAGFVAIVHLTTILGRRLGGFETELGWLVAIAAGVIGAIVLSVVFDLALIVISATLGAAVVTDALAVETALAPLAFVALAGLGVLVQGAALRVGRARESG